MFKVYLSNTYLPVIDWHTDSTLFCIHIKIFSSLPFVVHCFALLKGMSTMVAKALHLLRFALPLWGFISAIAVSQAHFSNPQAPKSWSISSLLIDICWLDGKGIFWVQAGPLAATAWGRSLTNGLFAKPKLSSFHIMLYNTQEYLFIYRSFSKN